MYPTTSGRHHAREQLKHLCGRCSMRCGRRAFCLWQDGGARLQQRGASSTPANFILTSLVDICSAARVAYAVHCGLMAVQARHGGVRKFAAAASCETASLCRNESSSLLLSGAATEKRRCTDSERVSCAYTVCLIR